MKENFVFCVFTVLFVCLGISQGHLSYLNFNEASTDWLDDGNWSSAQNPAYTNNATSPGNDATIGGFFVLGELDYTATQGTCTETSDMKVGRHGYDGVLNLTGGTFIVDNTWGFNVGHRANGILNVDGGALIVEEAGDTQYGSGFAIGHADERSGWPAGTGTVNLISGSIDINDPDIKFGCSGGAGGVFNIAGGTADLVGMPVFGDEDDDNGTGSFNFTPTSTGSLTITGADYAYYTGLYAAGNLTYDGTNAASFDAVFTVVGETIMAVSPKVKYELPAYDDDLVPTQLTDPDNDLVFTVHDISLSAVDIYLGPEDEPNLTNDFKIVDKLAVSSGQNIIDLVNELTSDLAYDTTYYWKVVGFESNPVILGQLDEIFDGPVWRFTTKPEYICDQESYAEIEIYDHNDDCQITLEDIAMFASKWLHTARRDP